MMAGVGADVFNLFICYYDLQLPIYYYYYSVLTITTLPSPAIMGNLKEACLRRKSTPARVTIVTVLCLWWLCADSVSHGGICVTCWAKPSLCARLPSQACDLTPMKTVCDEVMTLEGCVWKAGGRTGMCALSLLWWWQWWPSPCWGGAWPRLSSRP